MKQKPSILAVITARGGSKGVPGKNIKIAGGKPLIAWVIEAAKGASLIDRLILSSDDADIIGVAEEWGCEAPFVRPAALARDESLTIDVVLHTLDMISGYDYVVLLQPTSPLTKSEHIDGCIRQCIELRAKTLVSVCEVAKSPYWMFKKDETNRLTPFLGQEYLNKRRQDLPKAYIPTGAVYVAATDWLRENRSFYTEETSGYLVPRQYALDIDTTMDFLVFETLLENMGATGGADE